MISGIAPMTVLITLSIILGIAVTIAFTIVGRADTSEMSSFIPASIIFGIEL
jgi:hypothetical protein